MKQGTANNTNGGRKIEPICKPVSRRAVMQMGMPTGHQELYTGKGVQAPKASLMIHKKGSQR